MNWFSTFSISMADFIIASIERHRRRFENKPILHSIRRMAPLPWVDGYVRSRDRIEFRSMTARQRMIWQNHANTGAWDPWSYDQTPFQGSNQRIDDVQSRATVCPVHATTIIWHDTPPVTAASDHVYANDTILPTGKGVFARVNHKLDDDETETLADIYGQPPLIHEQLEARVGWTKDCIG
jgi:hypothetical protein